jgi:chromosome partitioning protein
MIVSVLNQKGGSGKTTIAIHASAVLARDGARVLLIDADPQGSALDWSALRQNSPAFPVIGLPKPVLHREMAALAEGYDHVVIDGPPQVADVTRSAILAADLVLIPVQPSPLDVWGARAVVGLLEEASVMKASLKTAFAISRKIVNTAIGRDVTDALAVYRLPVLTAALAQRVSFAEALASGQTVLETDPNGAASAEVVALTREIMEVASGKESADRPPARGDAGRLGHTKA